MNQEKKGRSFSGKKNNMTKSLGETSIRLDNIRIINYEAEMLYVINRELIF